MEEKLEKENSFFITKLASPAQRALKNNNITSLKKLSEFRKKEILKLHGIGPSSIPILEKELMKKNLNFKPDNL